jgi:hypothetical protein
VLASGSAVATACAVLALGMPGHALLGRDPEGTTPGAGGAVASAEAFPGGPSLQAAVDHSVAAIRAGDGPGMARILDKGYSAKARADRIWKADGHPVTRHPSPVTLQETPSIAWKTVVLHLDHAGVRSTEDVLAGPASRDFQGMPGTGRSTWCRRSGLPPVRTLRPG